jgi:TfoX/Sxy family transcriptional regulator of competence genes
MFRQSPAEAPPNHSSPGAFTTVKKNANTSPEGSAPDSDPAFRRVADAFADDPAVTYGKMMASPGLKVNGKIFAMLTRGRFVAKLPRSRVDALVASGAGERFDPGHGRIMKEWIVVASGEEAWLELAREAYRFVRQGAA